MPGLTVIAFGVCLMAACAFGYFQEARAQPANCLGSPADPRIAATYLDNFAAASYLDGIVLSR